MWGHDVGIEAGCGEEVTVVGVETGKSGTLANLKKPIDAGYAEVWVVQIHGVLELNSPHTQRLVTGSAFTQRGLQ